MRNPRKRIVVINEWEALNGKKLYSVGFNDEHIEPLWFVDKKGLFNHTGIIGEYLSDREIIEQKII